MSEHTIGPWFYDERTESIGSPAGWIASIPQDRISKSDVSFGSLQADANLIAAAPDLLAACKAVYNLTDVTCLNGPVFAQVMKAIQKAEAKDESTVVS